LEKDSCISTFDSPQSSRIYELYNYSFIEQINNSAYYYQQHHRIARIILIIGNTLQIEETGECPAIASPCWTDEFIINFDGDYNAGNIAGERYKQNPLQIDPSQEDPILCQGIMTGSFTRERVVDNGGINNDSGNGGGGCFITASAYEFRMQKNILLASIFMGSLLFGFLAVRQRIRKFKVAGLKAWFTLLLFI
jgi:hypothetical protein